MSFEDKQEIEILIQGLGDSEREGLRKAIGQKVKQNIRVSRYATKSLESSELVSIIVKWAIAGMAWDLLKLTIREVVSYVKQQGKETQNRTWVMIEVPLKNNSCKIVNLYIENDRVDESIDAFVLKINAGWMDDNQEKAVLCLSYREGEVREYTI